MSDPNSGKLEKKKSQRKRRTNEPICIAYDNPDLKVAVRLLPPTLSQVEFLQQLEEIWPSSRNECVWKRFFYAPGSKVVQPFEEPRYSRAYFLFASKDVADSFKNAMVGASFIEPDSGDLFLAQTMKPIFGAVTEIPSAPTLGDITQDPLFIKFMALRAAKAKNIDLAALVSEVRAAKDKKKGKKGKKNKKNTEVKAKSKSSPPTRKQDPAADGSEDPKPKNKRKKKKTKAGEKSIDSSKTQGDGEQSSAKEVEGNLEKPKKKKKKTKSKQKSTDKSEKLDPDREADTLTEPQNNKPAENSDLKANEAEKKKSRIRKKKPKPKAKASTLVSPSPKPLEDTSNS